MKYGQLVGGLGPETSNCPSPHPEYIYLSRTAVGASMYKNSGLVKYIQVVLHWLLDYYHHQCNNNIKILLACAYNGKANISQNLRTIFAMMKQVCNFSKISDVVNAVFIYFCIFSFFLVFFYVCTCVKCLNVIDFGIQTA